MKHNVKSEKHLRIFRAGDRVYTWSDIISASLYFGNGAGLLERVEQGLAAAAYAEERGASLGPVDLLAAANEVRYSLGLISQDDAAAFFDAWGLGFEDLCDYAARSHSRRRYGDDLDALLVAHRPPLSEVKAALWQEAVLSGSLRLLARSLAERVAYWRESSREGAPVVDREERESELERFAAERESSSETVESWLERWECSRAWLDELIEIDVLYQRDMDHITTPKRRQDTLTIHRIDLMRVEGELAVFADLNVALEVHMCVVQDGEPFGEVVTRAGSRLLTLKAFLADLSPPLKQALLSAMEGELVGPVEDGTKYLLSNVNRKLYPELSHPRVLERVDELLLDDFFSALIDRQVEWIDAKAADR